MPDREKVIKALEYCKDEKNSCIDCFYREQCSKTGIKADALALLKEQEAVVRCKDCKYWDSEEHDCNIKIGWFACGADWFCADGERRDDQ